MSKSHSGPDKYVERWNCFGPPLGIPEGCIFTYILTCEGSPLLKFGRSKYPQRRLDSMQSGCPHKLEIRWCWPEDVEKLLHQKFANKREAGEWFRVDLEEAVFWAAHFTKRISRERLAREVASYQ